MHEKENYQDINSKTIDSWIEGGWEWGIPISPDEFLKVKNGDWGVLLTPIKSVPKDWFLPFYKDGKLKGTKILGLASGGGQQMPVFAALDGECTVLDYSDRQLQSEEMVSRREGYPIEIVKADMTKCLPFPSDYFDLIFHPVSNCYVEDVCHVWRECFRVLKKGGVLLAGMDNGINYLFDEEKGLEIVNKLPFNPLKDPELYRKSLENGDGIQFSHTVEEQLGGQLKAGLILTDLYDDWDNQPGIGEYYPPFIASRAVKP